MVKFRDRCGEMFVIRVVNGVPFYAHCRRRKGHRGAHR